MSRPGEANRQNVPLEKFQQGDSAALADLREKSHGALMSILLARGASRTETEDILADMWADCVPGRDGRPSLLEKFSGKCTLHGWLATVATNRWIDFKRRQARQGEITEAGVTRGEGDTRLLDRIPDAPSVSSESTLVDLLRDSLAQAFARATPTALVLLRLVYVHELTQREIVRMLGWHESKISRFLSQAMEQIQTDTLRELKARDPWLELSWQDFVDLCQTHQLGFM